mmetsp:Transcript_22097/g.58334  ORF Transcript_22097/g.58334 Transcript_22097/m.58334 type:complete len:206 (+) Transcript_22097:92-709(+)
MSRLALGLVAACLASQAAAFTAPQGSRARLLPTHAASAIVDLVSVPRQSAEADQTGSSAGVLAACVGAAAVLGLRRQLRDQNRTALQAKPGKRQTMAGKVGMLYIKRTYNNTHVALGHPPPKGGVIWCTTEKRYGKLLPNTNYAIEAAIYTAQALGISKVMVQIKGQVQIEGALRAIRSMGIDVVGAVIRNTVAYGGSRVSGIRR